VDWLVAIGIAFVVMIALAIRYFYKGFWEQTGKNTADGVFPAPEQPAPPPPLALPPESELVLVGQQFQPQGEHAMHCAWVRQADLFVRQQEGYTFYTQGNPNQRFHRDINAGREFLMLRPPHLW
jgi:hypothetical protein